MQLSIYVFSTARENTHKHLNTCKKKRTKKKKHKWTVSTNNVHHTTLDVCALSMPTDQLQMLACQLSFVANGYSTIVTACARQMCDQFEFFTSEGVKSQLWKQKWSWYAKTRMFVTFLLVLLLLQLLELYLLLYFCTKNVLFGFRCLQLRCYK